MTHKAKKILRPLYVYAFIETLVFWYAIEKLLWSSSGVTPAQIIILGILAQSSQILIEVPSSIIADRWSRRKTLMAASGFMAASIAVVLVAQTFVSFVVMCVLWSCYFAFQSGTLNAYVYDLLKEQGEQAQYRKAIARFTSFELLGLLVSSLAAGVLIKFGGFLTPYWVTLLPTAVAMGLMFKMRDPPIERSDESMGSALNHVRSAAKNIAAKRWVCVVFVALAFITAGQFIWYEYYQLFALKREVAAVLFGLMLALIHVGNIAGSEFAHRIKSPRRVLAVAYGATVLSTAALAFMHGTVAIFVCLVLAFFGATAGLIVLEENLQHQTKSELRATTLSLVGLLSRIFFGIGALVIIVGGASPRAISFAALALFVCAALYLPVRRRLASAELPDDARVLV